jgi:hypothetical protein
MSPLPVWLIVVALALTALALVWSRWPGWAKALLVVGVTALYFAADRAIDARSGWPSVGTLPPRFALLAVVTEEPTPKQAGALYVWVQPIDKGKTSTAPRAYKLPYSRELHSLFGEAMKKNRQGISQIGTAEPKAGPQGYSWLRPGNEEQAVKVRDLPSPQLPEK